MYYIIFDLEATCEENIKFPDSEIIEIGAVCLDESLVEVSQFDQFLRPTIRPTLSAFCTSLTSITQLQVDTAKIFSEVIPEFENWILQYPNYILYSWGDYDRIQIQREAKHKNYTGKISEILTQHKNLKLDCAKFLQREKAGGMKRVLNELNIPLTGTHHRGIDDARNIAKIFRKIREGN